MHRHARSVQRCPFSTRDPRLLRVFEPDVLPNERQIIASYTPPPQTTLTRHLPTTHLNPQIAHLIRARPLSVSMGTAIRYLKYEISLVEMEMDLDEVSPASEC